MLNRSTGKKADRGGKTEILKGKLKENQKSKMTKKNVQTGKQSKIQY